ncbi:hypothetical protein [Aphanothece sacrum]|uniref:Chemotaxis protein CheY n=1 Tax=Aphanothece sacrum FPU1 TaxID=1920663 RepID=A0A401IJ83_APHSA|nr:hypothetical protein [Aphanothece sacrum]GBF81375.1 chemotaxis protein CheY [Aphanothece sacrum FPU1]GBF85434.1 chemotaxis protein CheY [Aphanothece sacrum FPU3]
MIIHNSHLLLDACCVFNFVASGHFLSILTTIPVQVVITQTVYEQELIKFDRFEPEDKQQFNDAIIQEMVKIVDLESEIEADLFVNYAAILGDDGESATGAIAINREWSIATDDKAAIKLFSQEAPNLQILSTPDIIKYWSEINHLSSDKLYTILDAIRVKARYLPNKNHPLENWWKTALKT